MLPVNLTININAGILHRLAPLASDRTDGSLDEAQQIDMDTIVAVVFSAVAREAFINELAATASRCPKNDPHCVKTFASLLSEAEQAKATIRFKYELVRILLKSYDKGSKLYEDFDLLFSVRDTVIHLKTNDTEFDTAGAIESLSHSKLLKRFRAWNIHADIDVAQFVAAAPSLLQWFSTRAVARWACNVAAEMVFSILDSIPESQLMARELRARGRRLMRDVDAWVVTCRTRAEAERALATAQKILEQLGVRLNPEQKRMVHVRHGFVFLAYKSTRGSRPMRLDAARITSGARPGALYAYPSEQAIQRSKDCVRQIAKRRVPLSTEEIIQELNSILRGWGLYDC
jgi:hypothetical protein